MGDFDSEINVDYHVNKQDSTTDLVSSITGGVTATVVDAAASFWNSLPGTTEVQTEELLGRISNNALQVYQENPDLIQTASFIGGSFIPGALAFKGMNLLRNGSKAVNWFTTAGKAEDTATVARLLAEGAGATKDYRNAVRGLYAKTAVNQALDAAAAEVAILSTMNASPLVEDYMKDPVKNFGISVALGGVLGGTVGVIANHFETRSLAGKMTEEALDILKEGIAKVGPGSTNGVAIQVMGKNVEFLDSLISNLGKEGKTLENDLTASMAFKMKELYAKELDDSFKNIVSPDFLSSLNPLQTRTLKDILVSSPEMVGVESISKISAKDAESFKLIKAPASAELTDAPILSTVSSKKGPIKEKSVDAVFFQESGLYGVKEDIKHYGGASALSLSAEQLAKSIGKNFGKNGNFDTILDLGVKSAPSVQGELIGTMVKIDKMKVEEFKKLKASTEDTQFLEAAAAKMAVDEDFAKAGLKIDSPFKYQQAVAAEKIVDPAKYDFAIGDNIYNYLPYKKADGLTDEGVMKTIANWIGANKNGQGIQDFRKGSIEYSRAGFTSSRANQTVKEAGLELEFRNVYESAGSIKLRNDFAKVADNEGFVFLWRGTKTDKDRSSVRSYTTTAGKAGQFGDAKLYKVAVDDIVAGFKDVGGGLNNAEILVLEGQRLPVNLSNAGKKMLASAPESLEGAATTKTLTLEEIQKQILANKQNEMDFLLQSGVPFESIAIKTNTPVEIVTEYALTNGKDFEFAVAAFKQNNPGKGLSKISNVDEAKAALDPMKAPLLLKGNLRKQSYTEAIANNNNTMLRDMTGEIIAAQLYKSESPFVNELANFLVRPSTEGGKRELLSMVYDRVSKANNQLAGNFFTQSADFAMRNMGDLGPAISFIGKGVQDISNRMINSIKEPLGNAMALVSKSPAEIVEFNTFKEVNASLSGWRTVKEGKLWQRTLDDRGNVLKNADGSEALTAVKYQGIDYKIVSPSVLKTIEEMQTQSKQLLDLTNTGRRIQGLPDVQDIGLWVPSFNPVNKFIAYVHDTVTDTTSVIWANTKAESEQLVRNYRTTLVNQGKDKTIKIYEKGVEQENWSRMNGRLDTMTMKVADSSMRKSGSSSAAIVRTDTQTFSEITSGYEHYVNSQMRNLADLTMYDITHELGNISKLNRYGYDTQPLTAVKRITDGPRDAAASIKNLLLGDSNLGNFEGWKSVNSSFETGLSMASSAVSSTWDSFTKPLRKTFLGGKKQLDASSMSKMDYEAFAKELDNKGIVNPWKNFDAEAARMLGLSKLEDSPDTSKRLVFASNALAATAALKFGELAQPLVNIMSLPILTSLAIANKMPANFLGVTKATAKAHPVQVMYEGMRASHDPTFAHFAKSWEEAGYFTPTVSEVNKTLQTARSFDKGAIQKTEELLDSTFVKIMSKPSDYAESIVRRQTMFTGMVLAKRLYPGLDDLGVTIFARDFMDKAVGNFHAAQRPVLFQGTLGVALGLFQTYSLTLGQSIYRQLELKNYKALGAAALTQSTIFGTGSLPGFHAVSNMIGEHFSDTNVDLTTGTYRAVGDEAAKAVLYGLPSLAGVGTHTRGDSNFRIPGLTGDNVVALNFAKQATEAVSQVAGSLGQGSSTGQALLEAISLQSMSRPLARGAELANGYSITRAGNTVQTPEEVWTTSGIMARVLSTRPVTEIKLREAEQMKKFYGAIDRDKRQEVVKELRTALRDGSFSDKDLAAAAEKYMRNGGTPAGWKASINQAIATTNTSGKEVFLEKLKPNSALNYMISNLD